MSCWSGWAKPVSRTRRADVAPGRPDRADSANTNRARHLSFVETGRARLSADMVVRLAEYLDVPLRERNDLLVAAGHTPHYPETSLDTAELGPVRDSLQLLLTAHEPCPAVVVDRQWNLVLGNRAVPLFTAGVAPHLLEPPANVLRLALHPDGMARASPTSARCGTTCWRGCPGRRCSPGTRRWRRCPRSSPAHPADRRVRLPGGSSPS